MLFVATSSDSSPDQLRQVELKKQEVSPLPIIFCRHVLTSTSSTTHALSSATPSMWPSASIGRHTPWGILPELRGVSLIVVITHTHGHLDSPHPQPSHRPSTLTAASTPPRIQRVT